MKQFVDFDSRWRERLRSVLEIAVLVTLSLYVLNAVGGVEAWHWLVGGRRYLNVLWVVLALYLLVSKCDVDRPYLWEKARLLFPVCATCLFLYFYHDQHFDLGFLKYGLLLVLAASVAIKVRRFDIKAFFYINSLASLLIFAAALYQIHVLGYVVPNGDMNQNIFAPMAMIIGSVSVFSLLYRDIKPPLGLAFALCGVLAVWVALRTSCRTAFVTEAILTLLFLTWAYVKLQWSLRKIAIISATVVAAMALVVLASPSVTGDKFGVILEQVRGFFELRQGETTGTSIGLRFAIWKAALFDVIPKHFFLGIGDINELNRFEIITGSSIDREFLRTLQHFHNEGINTMVMGGLLLFSVCNWLLFKLYMTARKEPALLCLLVGYVAYGLTEVAFLHKPCFFVFVSMWLLYECAAKNERRKAQACTTS